MRGDVRLDGHDSLPAARCRRTGRRLEDAEQLGDLASVGCRYAQGFLFARDLSAGEAELLRRAQHMRRRDDAAS